jgi:fructokinase
MSWRADSIRGLDDEPTSAAKVLGIGELLWDVFPDGPRLGGAPFNVIANLRRLGHPAAFVTAVGDDDLGERARAAAVDLGIDPAFIATSRELPTGTVAVVPDAAGGHRFEIDTRVAYESIRGSDDVLGRMAAWAPDAIVFGTLAQRFADARDLTGRVAAGPGLRERLYDVNLRDGCWTPGLVLDLLPLATVVKVNDEEAVVLASLLGCEPTATAIGERLATEFGVRTLCVTRGPDGAALSSGGAMSTVAGIPVAVADTVGAGDAFAAALLHGILADLPAAESLAFANRLGALVASRPGAVPAWSIDEIL